jgi:hypothetical protein
MGQLIDCSIEFTVRKQINQVRRVIADKGWTDRVVLDLVEDPTWETGYAIKLTDKTNHQTWVLNKELFKQHA